ncbi:hypothetical protein CEXT_446171 [Caerostris extrusa]|uniref:Uncharacterized protein n=1 Tax=Caerostris extrusa TaxID=172846 RepID=A0AAV4YAH1_CAEEX|nr:hypothetical protein CEXT_446171 [Caerostris extrusa]
MSKLHAMAYCIRGFHYVDTKDRWCSPKQLDIFPGLRQSPQATVPHAQMTPTPFRIAIHGRHVTKRFIRVTSYRNFRILSGAEAKKEFSRR